MFRLQDIAVVVVVVVVVVGICTAPFVFPTAARSADGTLPRWSVPGACEALRGQGLRRCGAGADVRSAASESMD